MYIIIVVFVLYEQTTESGPSHYPQVAGLGCVTFPF